MFGAAAAKPVANYNPNQDVEVQVPPDIDGGSGIAGYVACSTLVHARARTRIKRVRLWLRVRSDARTHACMCVRECIHAHRHASICHARPCKCALPCKDIGFAYCTITSAMQPSCMVAYACMHAHTHTPHARTHAHKHAHSLVQPVAHVVLFLSNALQHLHVPLLPHAQAACVCAEWWQSIDMALVTIVFAAPPSQLRPCVQTPAAAGRPGTQPTSITSNSLLQQQRQPQPWP